MGLRLAVVLGLVQTACRDPAPEPAPEGAPGPLVLVTIDTLRADHLGCYGYFRDTSPRLDAFATEGVRFARAVTPMATTLPAHTSMLTSTRPLRHGVVKNGLVFEPEDGLQTAAQLLGARGYASAGFVSASPLSEDTGIHVGFDVYDEPEAPSRRSEQTVDLALEWLDGRPVGPPFFLWVHLWDPHAPYEPAEGWADRYTSDEALEAWLERWHIPEEHHIGRVRFDVKDIHNRYDAEIRYTDHHLGRLLDGLQARGLYEAATVVVTADHGEGLWQHGWHDHGRIFNEQILVPLVLKPPAGAKVAPQVVESLASTLDVLPTVLPLIGVELEAAAAAQFEGVDLLEEARKYTFTERVDRHREGWEPGDKYALVTDRYKYFARSEADDQLFDLREDPAELVDVLAQRPRVAARLERQVQTIFASYLMRGGRRSRAVGGQRLLEKLEALGYMQ